ncbi:uncharacterized protein CLAFUR5_10008 [Fulvia fulva]|uniref:Uncharacterized protein n=1 Tax=Passalora fulva TaxID=5499 RepID=A0A9Q8URK6_PASFU|nr:uncharacterized protein CLAFUR5_10008 [Fulvia fulva]UJO19825.1 hypothetical protein CLAFUR5_10008 [Fulvia fulva]
MFQGDSAAKDKILSTPGLGYDVPEDRRRIDAILDHAEGDVDGVAIEAIKYWLQERIKGARFSVGTA